MNEFYYYANCVGWPEGDVHPAGGLVDMVNGAFDVTRKTFLKHVDRGSLRDLEKALGYATNPEVGLTMAGDLHVSYHCGKLHGKRVYFFVWSGIEYVFTRG